MQFRRAQKTELENIFLMGFDVWSDGASISKYLEDCHSSQKYARGEWYVLAQDDKLFSSLILYNFERALMELALLQLHWQSGI